MSNLHSSKVMVKEADCDLFQKKLTAEFITTIWKTFRESGNSESGKINKNVFKKVFMNSIGLKNEPLVDAIFKSIGHFITFRI